MYNQISCEYNMDTNFVELWFLDGSRISIDCTAVENAYADRRYERSELDYMICNDPEAYAEVNHAGETENYLKATLEIYWNTPQRRLTQRIADDQDGLRNQNEKQEKNSGILSQCKQQKAQQR